MSLAENGRLTNTLQQIPEAERYSYNFGGASQLIDGIFVSPALAQTIAAVTILHLNADYPDSLSHDTSPANLPYKATDHDLPLLVINPPARPAPATAVAASSTAIPANPASSNNFTAIAPILLLVAVLGGTAVIGGMAMARRR
jgi:hypothetical protein